MSISVHSRQAVKGSGCAFFIVFLCVVFLLPVAAQTSNFTDPRDNKTYSTVRIGNRTWMAENLNFRMDESWCYENDESNCQKYGRLYTWGVYGAFKACPSGWRLPSDIELDNLVKVVGGKKVAGKKLKSKTDWNGTDDFGFSALPGGSRWHDGSFLEIGDKGKGHWWSATQSGDHEFAYYLNMSSGHENAVVSRSRKSRGFSVRCLQE